MAFMHLPFSAKTSPNDMWILLGSIKPQEMTTSMLNQAQASDSKSPPLCLGQTPTSLRLSFHITQVERITAANTKMV